MSKARELSQRAGVDGALSNRNLIINGAMQVAQRGTSATAAVNSSYSTVDRFEFYLSGGGAYTTERSTGHLADTGHDTALKIAVTTADTSIAAGDYYSFLQKIEAQNLQRLQYGTSSAKEMTLSFWVRATKTGTQTMFVSKNDSTQYNFVQEYTINQSDTWEYKTIKIPALTASGITNDNGLGIQVGWILKYGSTYEGAAGSWVSSTTLFTTSNAVNNMDSTSNTFYLTGVQLEVDDTATPFEHRSYGQELALCQRFFWGFNDASGITEQFIIYGLTSTAAQMPIVFPTEMRAAPAALVMNSSPYWENFPWNSVGTSLSGLAFNVGHLSASGGELLFSGTFSPTLSRGVNYTIAANCVAFDAEL